MRDVWIINKGSAVIAGMAIVGTAFILAVAYMGIRQDLERQKHTKQSSRGGD